MISQLFSNPVVLVILLAVLYFWNGYRIKKKKTKRSFKKRYNKKKKENK